MLPLFDRSPLGLFFLLENESNELIIKHKMNFEPIIIVVMSVSFIVAVSLIVVFLYLCRVFKFPSRSKQPMYVTDVCAFESAFDVAKIQTHEPFSPSTPHRVNRTSSSRKEDVILSILSPAKNKLSQMKAQTNSGIQMDKASSLESQILYIPIDQLDRLSSEQLSHGQFVYANKRDTHTDHSSFFS